MDLRPTVDQLQSFDPAGTGQRLGFVHRELTILFAIALRGGGPYSLDRKIGREL